MIEDLLLIDWAFQTANRTLWSPGLNCRIGLKWDRLEKSTVLLSVRNRGRWCEMTV